MPSPNFQYLTNNKFPELKGTNTSPLSLVKNTSLAEKLGTRLRLKNLEFLLIIRLIEGIMRIYIQHIGYCEIQIDSDWDYFQKILKSHLPITEDEMWIYMPMDRSAKEWSCLSYLSEFTRAVKKCSNIGILIRRVPQTWMEQESEDYTDDDTDVYILFPFTLI